MMAVTAMCNPITYIEDQELPNYTSVGFSLITSTQTLIALKRIEFTTRNYLEVFEGFPLIIFMPITYFYFCGKMQNLCQKTEGCHEGLRDGVTDFLGGCTKHFLKCFRNARFTSKLRRERTGSCILVSCT